MDFGFEAAGLKGDNVTVWHAATLVHLNSVEFHKLRNVLEEFGQRSAAAQGLRGPITDIWRLRSNSEQRLYLQTAAAERGSCKLLGGLKIGRKKLFLHRANGTITEIDPLCVLDFYVHESCQRQGVGKALFEHMLAAEQLGPEQLAYDRPSPKLLAFLRKHYGLASYVPQNNNFVVFEQYFKNSYTSSRNASPSKSVPSTDSPANGFSPPYRFGGVARQTIQVLGTGVTAQQELSDKQWVPSSVRPPTASLQHSLHLQPADTSSSSSPLAGTAAAESGPVSPCAPAGLPIRWVDTDGVPLLQPIGAQQFARGSGFQTLKHGQLPAGAADGTTYKSFEQALMAGATNPAPLQGMGASAYRQQTGAAGSGMLGMRDSLDSFTNSVCQQQQQQQQQDRQEQQHQQQTVQQGRQGPVKNGSTEYGNGKAAYSLVPPYSSLEPAPGALLPADAVSGSEHVSLKRQEEQLLQQRLQQQVPQWEAAGAGPPGHLLAAPTSSYAVLTAGMAEVLCGRSQQQQQQQYGKPDTAASLMQQQYDVPVSWNGLPPTMRQQQYQQGTSKVIDGQQEWQLPRLRQSHSDSSLRSIGSSSAAYRLQHLQPGEISGCAGGNGWVSPAGSRGSSLSQGLEHLCSYKAAAATHRAGCGAASCLRMV